MNRIEINLNPSLPALPKVEDKTKLDIRYTLISPYVSVHIYWDKVEGELKYDIEEPVLDGWHRLPWELFFHAEKYLKD